MTWMLYGPIAAWLVVCAGSVWAAWRYQRGLGGSVEVETEAPVVVIAPVKGAGPLLPDFLARLRSQRYRDYRIVAVVESEDDPAVPVLRRAAGGGGASLTILVAGLSERQGQKVHNLLHALSRLHARDEIVAFIDADTLPSSDWLTRLVRPLVRNGADVVSGNRWFAPQDGGWPSAAVAAANISVVTAPRIWNVVWGGSTALKRGTMAAIDLEARWRGAVVDDVQLTSVLHEHRLRILSPRDLLVLSPISHTWSSAFAFGRRQYLLVRWYLPGTWLTALPILTVPILGFLGAVALALEGDRFAVGALVTTFLLGQARSTFRRRIAAALWGDTLPATPGVTTFLDRWLPMVWVGLHATCILSSAVSRRLLWAGVLYDVRGRNEVRVLRRLAAKSPAPL